MKYYRNKLIKNLNILNCLIVYSQFITIIPLKQKMEKRKVWFDKNEENLLTKWIEKEKFGINGAVILQLLHNFNQIAPA